MTVAITELHRDWRLALQGDADFQRDHSFVAIESTREPIIERSLALIRGTTSDGQALIWNVGVDRDEPMLWHGTCGESDAALKESVGKTMHDEGRTLSGPSTEASLMTRHAICCALLLTLCATASAAPASGDTLEKTTDTQKRALMRKGMDAARSRLTMPATVQFQRVYFSASRDNNPPVTCGEYRHKKADGSDSGVQRFISYGTADDTFLEEEIAPFAEAWEGLCK